MNSVYIIFIIIIMFSFVTGLCVTVIENKELKKIVLNHNNVDSNTEILDEKDINDNKTNTIVDTIKIASSNVIKGNGNVNELPQLKPYAIVDDEII